jgi:hypothetical protein
MVLFLSVLIARLKTIKDPVGTTPSPSTPEVTIRAGVTIGGSSSISADEALTTTYTVLDCAYASVSSTSSCYYCWYLDTTSTLPSVTCGAAESGPQNLTFQSVSCSASGTTKINLQNQVAGSTLYATALLCAAEKRRATLRIFSLKLWLESV